MTLPSGHDGPHHAHLYDAGRCSCGELAPTPSGEGGVAVVMRTGGTFDARDVQAWIDSLGPREAAMLAHLIGEREMRACVEMLGEMAEGVADLARAHGAAGRRKASRACREVVGTILRMRRAAQDAHDEHCGKPQDPPDLEERLRAAPGGVVVSSEGRLHAVEIVDPAEVVRFDGPGAELDAEGRVVRTWPGGGGTA